MKSDKCPHELLTVHNEGARFRAQCAECGLQARRTGSTPAEAREFFNRRRGKRQKSKSLSADIVRTVIEPELGLGAGGKLTTGKA